MPAARQASSPPIARRTALVRVSVDSRLMPAAADYARAMGERDKIDHRIGGSLPKRVTAAGYDLGRRGGESRAPAIRRSTMRWRGWKASAGHRKNLLNPHVTEIGDRRRRHACRLEEAELLGADPCGAAARARRGRPVRHGAAAMNAGPQTAPPAIELIGIDKRFGPVHANKNINLSVAKGTIHGIVGENGAGKSTLMSILYGFYQPDAGEIRINGKDTVIHSSDAAIAAGIGMVHQHFMLVEPFTVLENVMLGVEGGALLKGGIAHARAELQRLEREYALEVDPDAVTGELPVGLQQRVEILKALYRGADTLILDEPTGVLTPDEADHLFRILRQLKAQGKTIILITHKLREIMAVDRRGLRDAPRRDGGDARDGEDHAGGARRADGRPPRAAARRRRSRSCRGAPLLQVENLGYVDAKGVRRFSDVSFEVRAGEIVGIAGVAGNGQSELLEVLAGIRHATIGRGHPRTASRSRDDAQPTRRRCASRALPMCRRTATAWASSPPSRNGRTRRSAITATRLS